jgi:hypothetical protein
VSARIDQPLEVVEVEEEDRERRAGSAAALEQRLELLVQVAGVVETGEIVAHGKLAEALFAGAQRILRALAIGGVDARSRGSRSARPSSRRSACCAR